jgi:hypothetical protein
MMSVPPPQIYTFSLYDLLERRKSSVHGEHGVFSSLSLSLLLLTLKGPIRGLIQKRSGDGTHVCELKKRTADMN